MAHQADADYETGLALLRSADPGTPQKLERAIDHLKSALRGYPQNARWPRWSAVVLNLVQAYGRYAHAEGVSRQVCLESIERAIELDAELVDLARQRADARKEAYAHYQLAKLYENRLDGDRAANVEAAIVHCEQAQGTWLREKEPLRWAWLQRLSGYLYYRRLCGDPVENTQTSIDHLRQSLEVLDGMRETNAGDWAEAQFYLGVSLYRLSQLIDKQQTHLADAIGHLNSAYDVYAQSVSSRHERRATQHRLALAYLDVNTGNVREALARSVDWLEEVAGEYTEHSTRWAKAQIDLGVAYLKSMRGGRSESIEQAIACLERVQENAAPVESELRALLLHHLSVAYATRLIEDRTGNLRRARDYCERALEAADKRDLALWATIKADLTGTLWRLGTLERAQSRQEASKCFEKAIENGEALLKTSGVERLSYLCAFTCYILGNLYADRFRGSAADNQARAAAYLERALDFYGPENFAHRWANAQSDLGVLYLDLRRDDLAVDHFSKALQVLTPEAHPVETLRVARNLAHTYFRMRCWKEARGPYQKAIRAADLLYRASLLRSSKKVELGQALELYTRAGFALAQDPERHEDAVLTLEQGRARLLSEALERDRAYLEALRQSNPELVQRYTEAMKEYNELLQAEIAQQQDVAALLKEDSTRKLSRKLEQITQEAQDEGQPGALSTLTLEELRSAARVDAPLIYMAVTSAGTLALIVYPDEMRTVWRPLTAQALRERVWGPGEALYERSYLGVYARWRAHPQVQASRRRWFVELDDIAQWLWKELMGDIVDELLGIGANSAVLIPQGWLGLLPLHLAWAIDHGRQRGKRCWAMDQIRFSYVPNARALLAAREVAARVKANRLFAVSDPQFTLPYSDLEAAAACHCFDDSALLGGLAATQEAVVEHMQDYPVLHFSCHGSADIAQPLEGGLELAKGERLTLGDILALRLKNARLVLLSACETGLPGAELLDEVISLPTGLIQAGVGGVIGSLWSVSDVSTTILMARFYELWKGGCGLAPSEALHQAQRWLRDKTNGQRAEHYKRYLPEFGGQDRGLPVFVADELYKMSVQGEADENDFAHPFHWAAFTYTGA